MLLNKKRLLDRLVQLGIISLDLINDLSKISNMDELEGQLTSKNIISEENLLKIKGDLLNIPFIILYNKKIPSNVLNLLPLDIVTKSQAIPFEINENTVKIAMVKPDNQQAVDKITALMAKNNSKVNFYIISENDFKKTMSKNKNIAEEVEGFLDLAQDMYADVGVDDYLSSDDFNLAEIKKAPISKIISAIIRHGVDGGASDIHIEPEKDSSRVRYRVDGVLHTSLSLPASIHESLVSRIKVISNLKIEEKRIPQDGRIKLNINGQDIDFRVSIFPLLIGEKIVLRILDPSQKLLDLESLGFNKIHQNIIKENIFINEGSFFLTGPSGSGKTTTLYSILNILNTEGANIATLEDPIEYFIPGINQAQVKPEIGFDFAAGLRSILRQDPDIIMLGEVRDSETADLAINASLSGHFILSTLHTNDALSALPRLIDLGVEPFLLAPTIRVIIAQRLARKICDNCKTVIDVPSEIKKEILKDLQNIPQKYVTNILNKNITDINDLQFYKGKGCPECNNSGYKSRVVIAEVLVATDKLRAMLSVGYNKNEVLDYLRKEGMLLLAEDGLLKVLQGLTTLEELKRIIKK